MTAPARPADPVDQTVAGLLAWAVDVLTRAGVETPDVDAELLLAHATGTSRSAVRLARIVGGAAGDRGREPLSEVARRAYTDLVLRRATREPLQHITGTAAFRRLELLVGPGVFVPRPETEALVGWTLGVLAGTDHPPLVVDACTGSGAVALAVADEEPRATVWAVEESVEALEWARRNAERTGTASRVLLVPGDVAELGAGLLDDLAGRVDVLVANPPYVPEGTDVSPEAGHDPARALWAGRDGLDVIRPLVGAAARLVRPGGWLGLEHDEGAGAGVRAVLGSDGRWGGVRTHPDLTGRDRFTVARRSGAGP